MSYELLEVNFREREREIYRERKTPLVGAVLCESHSLMVFFLCETTLHSFAVVQKSMHRLCFSMTGHEETHKISSIVVQSVSRFHKAQGVRFLKFV